MKKLKLLLVLIAFTLIASDMTAQRFQANIGTQLVSRELYGETKLPGIFIELKRPAFSEFAGNGVKLGVYGGYGTYASGLDYATISVGALATLHLFEFINTDIDKFDVYGKLSTGYNYYAFGGSDFGGFGGAGYQVGVAAGAEFNLGGFGVFGEIGRHPQGLIQLGIVFGGG